MTDEEILTGAGCRSTDDVHCIVLAMLKERFDSGNHNLEAWKALSYCREFKIDIPEWILVYFTDTANRLCDLGTQKKNAKTAIANVIGIKGKELTRSNEPDLEQWKICFEIEEQLNIPWGGKPRTLRRAQTDVATSHNKSWETVRKIYEKWRKNPGYALALELAERNMGKK